ncbi:MAG TPA: GNAT family N-acetyltransferase [Thermoanaerobaculia bacterium]|nr:GNAT family N-acetyltransferase [Thermoanaerobaculia bacterium]
MPVDVVIRSYEAGDEQQILDLFARSFHSPRSLESWRWKFENDPWGRTRISLAFDDAGKLLGHYAGYPMPFVIDGKRVLANQIGDTMTDPSIRHIGRGPTSILGRTALHFYEHFAERNVAFNYGFNVANIQKFSLRFLRSDRVEPVTYRVRQAPPPVGRLRRWALGYQLELVTEVTSEYDAFFARVAPFYRFLVERNAQYLRWRYLQNPDHRYVLIAIRKWRKLAGWIVFRIRENRFTIGDALFDPNFPDAFTILLRHVVSSYPVELVEGWFPPRPSWFDVMLRDAGFVTHPEPQDLSVMCVPFVMQDAVARMRESLYYTWGDSDLF